MKSLVVFLSLFVAVLGVSQADDLDLKKYPQPEKGYTRQVIILPKLEKEEAHKVQLLIGKKAMVDSANMARMMGEIKEETLKGWGFPMYKFESDGRIIQTRRGGGKMEERFVDALHDYLIRYNSKLPIVVYVPEGFLVKYRVWSIGDEEIYAKEVNE
ncbi:ecotin [Rubritalea halochordaticola]|uniref:Ecotin n=1 Tax=Rubritalea halochordaticola TaxID=714537 RepID=A0ABP9UYD9_9BACT